MFTNSSWFSGLMFINTLFVGLMMSLTVLHLVCFYLLSERTSVPRCCSRTIEDSLLSWRRAVFDKCDMFGTHSLSWYAFPNDFFMSLINYNQIYLRIISKWKNDWIISTSFIVIRQQESRGNRHFYHSF